MNKLGVKQRRKGDGTVRARERGAIVRQGGRRTSIRTSMLHDLKA